MWAWHLFCSRLFSRWRFIDTYGGAVKLFGDRTRETPSWFTSLPEAMRRSSSVKLKKKVIVSCFPACASGAFYTTAKRSTSRLTSMQRLSPNCGTGTGEPCPRG